VQYEIKPAIFVEMKPTKALFVVEPLKGHDHQSWDAGA